MEFPQLGEQRVLCMRIFKKVLFSVFSLLCCLVVLYSIIIAPSRRLEAAYYNDNSLRKELSGSIDLIVLGASHALAAFDPQVIDHTLNCNSYNLSSSMMTSYSKYFLLKKEMSRNPVDTVVLEISFDSFARNEAQEYGDGDSVTIERLDSFSERVAFMGKYVGIEDWMNIFSRELMQGMYCWKRVLSGSTSSSVDYSAKGFHSKDPMDITLTPDEAKANYAKRQISLAYHKEPIEITSEMIRFCKSKNARVILCVTPLPDSLILKRNGWDDFYQWIKAFSDTNDCTLYDFNLLKSRYELFSDSTSFYDEGHMSGIGAAAFSQAFGEIMAKAENGEDVSQFFYDSYSEMIQDSPYMRYIN